MDLLYYTPNKLYSYPNIVQIDPVQVSFSQMFNASISLVDRSKSINCPPIPIKILNPMLKWKEPEMFDDLCFARYNEILKNTLNADKHLVIFYSGGIDSTLIAALAITHPEYIKHKDRIILAFNEDSIKENPNFWYDFLLPSFGSRIGSASAFHNYIADDKHVCLTGEFADNIFGSLTVKSYMDVSGDFDAIHKDFSKTGKRWLLNKITNKNHLDECSSLLDTVIDTSPRSLISNHDCFWWLNFVMKWQAVRFRLVSHAPTNILVNAMINNVVHFFDTEDFQHWAVMTQENKVENDWFSYKIPAKKIIYAVNKDEYYFQWKTKYPSIPSLTRYTNMYDFIYYDENSKKYIASKTLLET